MEYWSWSSLEVVIAAFDRCALLSIWKAEGPVEGPRFSSDLVM